MEGTNWYDVPRGDGDNILRSASNDRHIILNMPEVELREYYGM